MRTMIGKLLMSLGAEGTVVVPYLVDWNKRHNFGPGYSPHARLHATEAIFTATSMGSLALWLIWRGTAADRRTRMAVAALIPIMHWGTYNLAALVPTTSVDPDKKTRAPRLLGVLPVNLAAQNLLAFVTGIGYLVQTRLPR
jgi:hypothetical protein